VDRRRFLVRGVQAVGAGMATSAGLGWTRAGAQVPAGDAAAPGGSPSAVDSANVVADSTGAASSASPSNGAGGGAVPIADLVCAKGEPKQALRRALDALGGVGRFVKPGDVVANKPNASFISPPEWGATTHPIVLCALMDLCFEAGARRAIVVDYTLGPSGRCFARTGIADAVAMYPNAKLVALSEEREFSPIDVPLGAALHKTTIANVVTKADVFINLPSAKAHTATKVSLGLKNLMGLVWDRQTFHNDMDIHVGIADLATVLRPDLTIIDAFVLLQTGGPSGPGDVANFGGIVAGTDPVAVDAYGIGLSPWNHETLTPDQIGYIRHAAQRGVGTLDLTKLRVLELA
jgi:uncharacterized protein (DUF362 family)